MSDCVLGHGWVLEGTVTVQTKCGSSTNSSDMLFYVPQTYLKYNT